MNENLPSDPFDFLSKLEEKGIFSSSRKKNRSKKVSGSGIGGILKKVFEEIAQAEREIEEQETTRHAPPPPPHDRKKAQKKEKVKDKTSAYTKKKAEPNAEKSGKNQEKNHSFAQEAVSPEKKKKSNCYKKQLRGNKRKLRQAVVFSEIISRPVGLR